MFDSQSHLIVDVRRGGFVESRHRVSAAVVDPVGQLILSYGDPELQVPPRSAMKSLQALPLVSSGAADHFGLDDKALALACASHSGDDRHVASVAETLAKIGLDESYLGCGPDFPLDPADREAYIAGGGTKQRIRHNCSGKHAGFLALGHFRGHDPDGYLDPAHPVQQESLAAVAEACGEAFTEFAVDGCGGPVVSMPLTSLAKGMASMVDPAAPHTEAAARLRAAMAAEPHFVAGTDRLCTRIGELLGDAGYVKVGAEGVYTAALVDGKVGVALKAHDGATRAAEAAIVQVLVELGAIAPDAIENQVLKNPAGDTVGEVSVR